MGQNIVDELRQRQFQPQRQILEMHENVAGGESQSKLSALRAKFYLDPKGEADAIFRQVFVNLFLAVELRGLWIEIHADPVRNWNLFPFSSTTALPLLMPLTAPNLPPFIISEEEE